MLCTIKEKFKTRYSGQIRYYSQCWGLQFLPIVNVKCTFTYSFPYFLSFVLSFHVTQCNKWGHCIDGTGDLETPQLFPTLARISWPKALGDPS